MCNAKKSLNKKQNMIRNIELFIYSRLIFKSSRVAGNDFMPSAIFAIPSSPKLLDLTEK